ncbi:unnamed protein product (macronuclear) [Paramecium tetraurelia]|uniref:Uncharacterized protein n=1 Tax=Paramecium tetraurelia TaxID=5888 RepID=A0E2E1_PARTE|nr:uncharacterized protein GSPATT00022630001 [Paramecium tetraurelia]CAK89458.1 unnamed protein product [Paramecium tetraurelia]|eukprot:XP_001456855.1 hypothetical protein (macronuclear) [Paramecium tetraurelia strain d4-2]
MVLPKVNMFVGICALSFQAFVLYPWHDVISQQVEKLDKNIRILEIMQQQLVKEAEQLQKLNPI